MILFIVEPGMIFMNILKISIASLLFISAPVFANGGFIGFGGHSNRVPSTIINLSANLAATSSTAQTPVSTATGSVSYFYNSASGNSNLQADLHLPIDGTVIKDSNAAVNNTYTLTVNAAGSTTPLATCTLVISDIDALYNKASSTPTVPALIAQYQNAVSEVGSTVTAFAGDCSLLGSLSATDTVNVSLTGSTTPILTGTLSASFGHGFL